MCGDSRPVRPRDQLEWMEDLRLQDRKKSNQVTVLSSQQREQLLEKVIIGVEVSG